MNKLFGGAHMTCIARIENYLDSFTTSEKKIANYIIQNAENVVKLSIHELAAEIDVAPSSITRFARKLNYKSFSEMRIELVRSIDASIVNDFNKMLQWNSNDTDEFSRNFITTISSVFEDTLSLNDFSKFEQVTDWIKSANIVYLFGVGASRLVAEDLQQKLMKLNKRCIFNIDNNFGVQNAVLTRKDDIVIAFSYGGRTKEVNLAVKRAKKNGCKIVSITHYGKTPLSQLSDVCLYVPNVEQVARLASIFSRYAQMFIVDMLFANYAKKIDDKPEQLLTEYRTLLDTLKE